MSCNKHYSYVYEHTHSLQLSQLIHLDTQSNTYHHSQLSAYLHSLKAAKMQHICLFLHLFSFMSKVDLLGKTNAESCLESVRSPQYLKFSVNWPLLKCRLSV